MGDFSNAYTTHQRGYDLFTKVHKIIIYCTASMAFKLEFIKCMSLKHGDQNLYENDFSYFTNKMIIDKPQFWIHCKSKTVYTICTKSRHIIHFMNTTTNWPPKRSMMYAILFKQKEIETTLMFPYLCHFS